MAWYRLFNPAFWSQNRKSFKPWDEALNVALDECGISDVGKHECWVGPFTVWISNYPYGFGYNKADALELLPRAWTRRRLRREIERWHKAQYVKQIRDMKLDALCDS